MRQRLNPAPKRGLRAVNWNEVLKRAAQFANATAVQAKKTEVAKRKASKVSREKGFLRAITYAREWTDIELLMPEEFAADLHTPHSLSGAAV